MKLYNKVKNLVGVKELLNNNLTIEVTNGQDKKVVQICEKIALENSIENGGTLNNNTSIILKNWSDFLITCKKDKQIVGFVSLKKDFTKRGDLYVMLISVKKDYHNQGIGTAMYNYLTHHSKGYVEISAHVDEKNIASRKTLQNAGFIENEVEPNRMFFTLNPQKIKDNSELQITVKNELIK